MQGNGLRENRRQEAMAFIIRAEEAKDIIFDMRGGKDTNNG